MNCPKCNATNKSSASYCLQCGFRLSGASPEPPSGVTAVPEPASGRSDGRKKTMVMGPGSNPLADAAPKGERKKTQVLTPDKREPLAAEPKPTPVEARRPAARTAYFAPGQNPLARPAGEAKEATQEQQRRKLRGWLASFDFDTIGRSWELGEGRNFVGRDPEDCAIVLDKDPTVSRKHCLIMVRPNQVYVKDQDSEYGTVVNGQEIGMESKVLADGDRLTVCGYNLTIKLL